MSVPAVQSLLNGKLKAGQPVRNVQILRQILSAALSRAMREKLVARNVARLVELPRWEPAEVVPWSADEALAFLAASAGDRLHPAFVLLLLYGMRRGEVLGLHWADQAKDAQVILGHAHVSPTSQIYTHVEEAAKRDAIARLNKLLGGAE